MVVPSRGQAPRREGLPSPIPLAGLLAEKRQAARNRTAHQQYSVREPWPQANLLVLQAIALLNISTRPLVSTSFCLPVKNGWHLEHISTLISFLVDRVLITLPQAR